MPERKKIFIFLLFAALTHKVTSLEKQMDMAPNAVDDQYFECRDEMLKKMLEEEQRDNPEFSNALAQEKQCKHTIAGGVKEHMAALAIFGKGVPSFIKAFNNAVATLGANVGLYKRFQFKFLHFLLMDIMQLLKTRKCETIFYGSDQMYTAQVGSEVRFGMFPSASDEITDQKEEAISNDGTFFNITSCTAVNVKDYHCNAEYAEWLISPAEVFKVVEVKEVGKGQEKYKEIVLTSSRILSNHNCFLFPRSPPTNSPSTISPTGSSTQQFSSSVYKLVNICLAISQFTRASLTK